MTDQRCLTENIRVILSARTPEVISMGIADYRHAGVLLPLLEEDGTCNVLFTKRTEEVEHHKGQISFPGGAVDEGDSSIEETALRETYEEIGLVEEHIEILGRLDDTLTILSRYVVHPVVGAITCADNLNISRAEVDRIIKVPLSVFFSTNLETGTMEYEGDIYETPAYVHDADLIWGATARMMANFVEIIGNEMRLPRNKK